MGTTKQIDAKEFILHVINSMKARAEAIEEDLKTVVMDDQPYLLEIKDKTGEKFSRVYGDGQFVEQKGTHGFRGQLGDFLEGIWTFSPEKASAEVARMRALGLDVRATPKRLFQKERAKELRKTVEMLTAQIMDEHTVDGL